VESQRQAQQGFEGFRDSPDAPFYRSGAMSPQETWAEATRRLTRVLDAATIDAESRVTPMTVERICGWHRAIFLTTFESHAGRVREDHESVEFAVPVEIDGEMRDLPVRGTMGRSAILKDLSTACEAFNTSSAVLRTRYGMVKAIEGATPAAALYAAILKTHPFLDGNLRAAYVALILSLTSVGLPAVDFRAVLDRHDECLGWAMREDAQKTVGPLAMLIVGLAA
jgi:fido (protein-threonine AMPylation protein)